jgi:transcriptional regulator with XRE-family HTH domain
MTPTELRAARHALDLTAAGFAQVTGVDERTVRRWEAGERSVPPCVAIIARLALEIPQVREALSIGELLRKRKLPLSAKNS